MPRSAQRGAARGAGALMLPVCGALRGQVRVMCGELGGLAGFVEGGRALGQALAAMPGQDGAQQSDRLVRVIGDAPAGHRGPVGNERVEIARAPAIRGRPGQQRRPSSSGVPARPRWSMRVGAPRTRQRRPPGIRCSAARSAALPAARRATGVGSNHFLTGGLIPNGTASRVG